MVRRTKAPLACCGEFMIRYGVPKCRIHKWVHLRVCWQRLGHRFPWAGTWQWEFMLFRLYLPLSWWALTWFRGCACAWFPWDGFGSVPVFVSPWIPSLSLTQKRSCYNHWNAHVIARSNRAVQPRSRWTERLLRFGFWQISWVRCLIVGGFSILVTDR